MQRKATAVAFMSDFSQCVEMAKPARTSQSHLATGAMYLQEQVSRSQYFRHCCNKRSPGSVGTVV